jgi:hypothetical protein
VIDREPARPTADVVEHADPRVWFKPLVCPHHFEALQCKNNPEYILQQQRRRCRGA